MRSSSKAFAVVVAAALMVLGTIDAFAANPAEQDYCSQLEVNCMLDDGGAVRVCTRAVRGYAPKYERTAESSVRGDYGPCGLWRLPWREQQQEVARPVPIGFSGSTP
jgi:hypothetical protein